MSSIELEIEKQAVQELRKEVDILGCFFWYTISGNLTFPRAKLHDAMARANISSDLQPNLKSRNDFIRVLRQMEVDRLIRKVAETSEMARFQATKEFVDGLGLSYEKEAIIELDKESGIVTSDNEEFRKIVVERMSHECGVYNSGDLRRLLQRILGQNCQAIKPRSGVYFIVKEKETYVESIKSLLEELNMSGCCNDFPIAAVGKTKEQMAKICTVQIRKLIEELQEEIKSLSSGEEVRDNIITRRYETIIELREKISLYRDALAIETESFDEKLTNMEEEIAKAIAG